MLTKALDLAADSLILDLEDAVTPDRKVEVRGRVCEWLATADFGDKERLVRINPVQSQWGRDDLQALMQNPPDGIVVPKVRDLADVELAHRIVSDLEKSVGLKDGTIPLLLIGTEDAAAVFNLYPMAGHARVAGVAWGSEDLASALGARTKYAANGKYLEVFSVTRSLCLLAAKAAGVQAIDAVYADIRNSAGLEQECRDAADMGFTGKITIHPAQIDIVNRAFTPTAVEVAEAQELLQAFAENRAAGRMAFAFKGKMVDAPHLKQAQEIIARAGTMESP